MLGIKWLFWTVATASLPLYNTGRCLFGNSEDCAFKCHCKDVTECNNREVTCPGGCASQILGYEWRGPACQIGNVAYHKKVQLHGHVIQGKENASQVVDGLPQPNCADVFTSRRTVAQLSVDLGYQYRIVNITIHFSIEIGNIFDKIRKYFTVAVSDTNGAPNTGVVCVTVNGTSTPVTYNIRCPDNTAGRYVYFSRLPESDDSNRVLLCEMIVFGYRPIDCSTCPTGVFCNDVTGCKQCSGSYQPDCKQGCDQGFYGVNCQEECGECTVDTTCDKINGTCPSGCKQWWATDLCQTYIKKPDAISELPTVRNVRHSSIDLEWIQITVHKDIATFYGYEIRHKRIGEIYSKEVSTVAQQTGSFTNNITLSHLEANTRYELVIYPYREWNGKKDYGLPYSSVTAQTACAAPEKPVLLSVMPILNTNSTTDVVDVTLKDIDQLYSGCDYISRVWLQYRLKGNHREFSIEQNLTTQTFSFEPHYGGIYLIWITVENNGGLKSSSDIWNVTVTGPSAPKASRSSKTIIIAVPVAFISVILVVIIAALLIRRKRNFMWKKGNQACSHEDDLEVEMYDVTGQVIEDRMPPMLPKRKTLQSKGNSPVSNGVYNNIELEDVKTDVKTENFEDYVNCRMDTDQFAEEYASLPPADLDRCFTALLEDNIKYNRYRKIYPYDSTRVILGTYDSRTNDFINANYISGYRTPKEYIATQGPFTTTAVDFWRMIWQEGSNRIVMVTNIEENGKIRCCQYWPATTGVPLEYGPFTLTTEDEDITADYTTRKIRVKKDDTIHTVHQFHFTSWADKSQPVYGATTLIAFYRKVHSFDDIARGPLVVHCSAGIGRTGTFIALDILQKQAARESKLTVYDCVKKLRSERMLMVQTKAQYVFMHKFLVEFIKCGFTSYDIRTFEKQFQLLSSPDDELAGRSLLDCQFQILCEMKEELNDSQQKGGLLAENKNKNRDLDIVPSDIDRPRLYGRVKDNYINAVYVDSFRTHDFFVATQMPLPETVKDFWRLVYKLKARSVIMLNQFDNTDQTSKPYWPSKERPKQIYGSVEVSFIKANDGNHFDCICTRDFRIKSVHSKHQAEGHTVRQFQLLTWPNQAKVPPNKEDLLKLIYLTEEWQQQFKSRRAGNAVVHCLTGGKQSGVFCGAAFVLDKMKSEQQIDALLAARYVTRRRPQFFQAQKEFTFLYDIAFAAMKTNTST